MGMLGSAVKAWHAGAAELIGRLIINPDNEPFLLPFASQVDIPFDNCNTIFPSVTCECSENSLNPIRATCRYINV